MDRGGAEHRLTAILSADVVGYSRLMAEDEAATVRTLTAYRDEVSLLVTQHGGRVVDATGDNLLAEFPSTLDAVGCAVQIQRAIAARNADLPDERRMQFRIGVHLGDVRSEAGRIYGDGVNIAARLEGLAEPGGISVSSAVRDQIRGKLELDFDDRGPQRIKNLPEPVHVYAIRPQSAAAAAAPSRVGLQLALAAASLLLLGGAFFAWRLLGVPDTAAPAAAARGEVAFADRPAIAVLPFDNLSGDPDQDYFADGIAEDLLTRLSAWRGAPIIARNSSFVYKGEAVDVMRVGRELGARYVVEGSVRRAGERVRVSAQLIDATTGHHVWAKQYDRELRDVFALQDEITAAIAASVQGQVSLSERARASRLDPQNLEAWELVLRADWHANQFTLEGSANARSLYERAIELDPRYARAFVGLASVLYAYIGFRGTDNPERSIEELMRTARTAVSLDPRDAEAHVALASAYSLLGEWDEMYASTQRAVALNPSSARAASWLGWSFVMLDRTEESIATFERALRLSPGGPDVWLLYDGLAGAHFHAAHYADSVTWGRKVVRARPDFPWAYFRLASTYAHLERLDEARTSLAEGLRLQPNFSRAQLEQVLGSAAPYVDRYLDGLHKAGWEG
jgi:adenylate cyclase